MSDFLDRIFGFINRGRFYREGLGELGDLEPIAATRLEAPAPDIVVELGREELTFESPLAELLPPEARMARARTFFSGTERGLVLLFAASGDEGYGRRTALARQLMARGFSVICLENPYYGVRRPHGQDGPWLRIFRDQLIMNLATIEEGRALAKWASSRGPVCLSGFSMGGFMASYAAAYARLPLAVMPAAAGLGPAPVYTEYLLSKAIAWKRLPTNARELIIRAMSYLPERVPRLARGSSAIVVAGRDDGFVPVDEVENLARHLGSDPKRPAEIRWFSGGHVRTFLRTRAIATAIDDVLTSFRKALPAEITSRS